MQNGCHLIPTALTKVAILFFSPPPPTLFPNHPFSYTTLLTRDMAASHPEQFFCYISINPIRNLMFFIARTINDL
jgi:hypothetical protein